MKNASAQYFEAGEYTTMVEMPQNSLIPNRTCGHRHRTEAAADKCASVHYPWITYVVIDGRRTRAAEITMR